MIKINMGCGWRNFGTDWVHIDGGEYEHLDAHDITKLSYDNDSVDLIYASHVLEYFDHEEAIEVLAEWNRVLKPSAILRLAVPDFETISRLYTTNNCSLSSFLGPLYGKMKMSKTKIYHKTVYDMVTLKSLLEFTGFANTMQYDWRGTEHGHIDDHSQAYIPHMQKETGTLISLNVECTKVKK
jgi:predicted SAM-dependent methyltransferase